ncbi:YgjV family protein, partial [Enterobacter hormaechei]|nr:YgjV family protein [Enterobacter hormaechei]
METGVSPRTWKPPTNPPQPSSTPPPPCSCYADWLGQREFRNRLLGWPFFTDYRTVVKIQSVGAAAFALYFLMLGSPTAAIACLISCTQLIISASIPDRYIIVRLYGASLILLAFLAIITWHG